MSVQSIDQAYKDLIPRIGKNAIAAIYPQDFDLYITAFELVDFNGRVIEYFIFPINPSSISVFKNQITNVTKTAGGVVTTSIQTFVPFDIQLQGNFGRKFKFLLGKELINFTAFNLSEQLNKNISNYNNQVFSDTIKTGYGCIKILQRIIDKSNQLNDAGLPNTLHFYNLSFGESHIVKVINQPLFSQNIEKNMIWEYSLQLKALAPLNSISKEPSSLSNLKLLSAATIQKGINGQLNSMVNSLQNG